MERITKRQEQILRMCHHDFEGLTQAEAAKRLGVSQQTIFDSLEYTRKAMPQFFPILTKLEAKVYHYYMVEGWKVIEIAQHLGQSENAIYKTLQRTRDKGMFFPDTKNKVLSYDPSMDADVREQF